jgi:hypothetical protein
MKTFLGRIEAVVDIGEIGNGGAGVFAQRMEEESVGRHNQKL